MVSRMLDDYEVRKLIQVMEEIRVFGFDFFSRTDDFDSDEREAIGEVNEFYSREDPMERTVCTRRIYNNA